MSEIDQLPIRSELEKELARFREVSSGIDNVSKLLVSGEFPADEVHRFIEEYVAEQCRIVDRFIEFSHDYEALQKFTDIVQKIQLTMELLRSCSDEDEYLELKKEVMKHIEEWIDCLELIIIGVINRAPREG
ncbi:MAG: hypothetical protein K8T10_13315 [Candidatus Eremiobacteraeota bacterium]|nr:hypothetical protein [Candidatus Eremiobacteraeota bacterium]